MKKTRKKKTPIAGLHFDSRHPHAHLHQHLLLCNKLHDHRQTHTNRVSSNTRRTITHDIFKTFHNYNPC